MKLFSRKSKLSVYLNFFYVGYFFPWNSFKNISVLTLVLRFIQAFSWYNLQKFWNLFRLSGLVFHQHKVFCTLTRKLSDFQYVILELDRMVLFCIIYMKMLKYIWTIFGWKNEEKCNWCQKKEMGFLVNDREFFVLSHFIITNQN